MNLETKFARTSQFHYRIERRVAQATLCPRLEKPEELSENLHWRYPPRLPMGEFLRQQP